MFRYFCKIYMNRTIINKLSYIGAAISEGQTKTGVAKGPQLVRKAGLFKHLQTTFALQQIKDYGDINFDMLSDTDKRRSPIQHIVQNIHQLDPVLGLLSQTVHQARQDKQNNNLVLTVGGDHSIGSATINGSLKQNPNLKVIWVDAHADFVHPQMKKTTKQNYHGMPLSHITGHYKLPGFSWMTETLPYENIVLIGIRDIEQNQYVSLRERKIKCFTMDHVEKYGIGNVMTMAMEYLDPKNQSEFHLSFDIDAMDPSVSPHTGTLFKFGLSPRQGCHIVRRLVHERKLVSFDLVEINEQLGPKETAQLYRSEEHINEDVSKTVKMGVDLISSLFEKNFTL